MSPDGRFVAEIDPAWEVSMSNPTSGSLRISSGRIIERCNPSFIWSDDSRYLVVPRYFRRWGLLRRQRLLLLDIVSGRDLESRRTAYYFQPESFVAGVLVVTKEPFHTATRVTWRVPEDLEQFTAVALGGGSSQPGDGVGKK